MRHVSLWLIAALWLSGCAGPVTAGTAMPAVFNSGPEVMAALQAAGAQTSKTEKMPVSFFRSPGAGLAGRPGGGSGLHLPGHG